MELFHRLTAKALEISFHNLWRSRINKMKKATYLATRYIVLLAFAMVAGLYPQFASAQDTMLRYEPTQEAEQRKSLRELRLLLNQYTTFKADYGQFTATSETLDNPEEFKGAIYWQRPNNLRMEQSEPWSELHVSDGKDYWHYEEDLEQAVRYSADALSSQFISLLINNDLRLLDYWHLKLLKPSALKGLQAQSSVFVAQSKSLENQQIINLHFNNHDIQKIRIDTGLGEIITFEFHNIIAGSKLSPKLFSFNPPRGVEVIDSNNP